MLAEEFFVNRPETLRLYNRFVILVEVSSKFLDGVTVVACERLLAVNGILQAAGTDPHLS